jgi:EmrB/QacA subfamily drug resistance transporter
MAVSVERSGRRPGGSLDGSRRRLLLIGLALGLLLAELDATMFITVLPTLAGELDGVQQQHWVNTAYVLAGTVTMLVYGQLSDVLGRRRVFLAALVIFLLGSCLGGLAWDMGSLIAARALQGLGGGGLLILLQAVVADVVPARERAPYLSAIGAVFVVAALAGPVLGGWLSEGIGWRWAFWLNLPLGGIAVLAAALLLPSRRGTRSWERVDLPGALALTIAITSAVLWAAAGARTGWTSPLAVSLAAVAVMAIGMFLAIERRAAEPVLPLELFSQRNFAVAVGAGLLIGVAVFGTVSYLPTYLQMVVGLPPMRAGLLMLALIAGVGSATVGSAQLVRRLGHYRVFPIFGSILLAVALMLLSTLSASAPLTLIAVYLFLLGAGLGCAWEVLVVVVQNTVPSARLGAATAANGFLRELGVTLGTAAIGLAFSTRLSGLLAERVAPGQVDPLTRLTPERLLSLPEPVHAAVVSAYHDAFIPVLLAAVPLMIISAVMLGSLRATPLATELAPVAEREGVR